MFLAIVPALISSRGLCMGITSLKVKHRQYDRPLMTGTVMITGASRGLGLEFVKQLTKLPTPPEVLIATCRNPETAIELQAVAQTNPTVKIIKLDVEKDTDIESAFKKTEAILGDKGLNLLINNAGIYDSSDVTLTNLSREMMQRHFNVNVSGSLMVTQKFLPLLKRAATRSKSRDLNCSRAGIIMISSHMGSQTLTLAEGIGQAYHYKCSKTALNMAVILLSRELKDDGVFVAAIHPGWVRTDMGSSYAPMLPEDSVRDCLRVIGEADEDSHGRIITFDGKTLPF